MLRHAPVWFALSLLLAGCPADTPDGDTADTTPAAVCGDGVAQEGEACDDGNAVGGDGCNATCTSEEYCGNGILDRGEQCEDGGTVDGDGCSSTCQAEVATTGPRCGDGTTDVGEECDDNNLDAGDGCSALCRTERCGNGFLDPGEGCEDGNTTSGDGCDKDCHPEVISTCGDGTKDADEACDDGDQVAGDGCSPYCTIETCGSGVLDPGEQCEDGNTTVDDGCDDECMIERTDTCGDGTLDAGEQCDDGGNAGGDGCSASCRREECGNGVLDPGEQCEDGNDDPGDGCNADCQREDPPACGDGVLDVGEECDDGDLINGDGCNAFCRDEGCGNGVLEPGEQCEDGNDVPGDGCDGDCQVEVVEGAICGNSVVEAGEQCDDGARIPGDGCNAFCRDEACGNGILDPGEQCEDGNDSSGDGCSSSCEIEAGSGGTGGTCGNSALDAGEDCDDGGRSAGDGCSPYCTFEVCGNGILDPGEVCEDGNEASGDGCRADCTGTERCGDSLVDVGEACDGGPDCTSDCRLVDSLCGNGELDPGEGCDDGGLATGDGCDDDCKIESCGDGVPQAPEECDDGDADDGDDCPSTCRLARCGDGFVRTGLEGCDDGNRVSGDGCDGLCRVESCGNGRVDAGEQCDDGDRVDTNACTNACRPARCGDGVVWEGVEFCDDGNTDSGDGCRGDCQSDERCGNGLIDAGEGCDDGDSDDGDACPTTCQYAFCGDGLLERGEEACDDGNDIDTDACADCVPVGCGNGVKEPGELCDEGGANGTQGAGCAVDCIPVTLRFPRVDHPLVDVSPARGLGPVAVAVGDVDGDGWDDLAVGSSDDASVSVLRNRRDGVLVPSIRTPVGSSPDALAIGDFDEDDHPDVAVANESGDNVSVRFGGDLGFTGTLTLTPPTNRDNPESIVAVDVDGDTHLDLVWAHSVSDSVAVAWGNGAGGFSTPIVLGVQGDAPVGVAVGDVTNDQRNDIVTVNRDDDTVSILAGQTNRTFAPAQPYSTRASSNGDSPRAIRLEDVSGDDVPDVIVTSYTSSDVTVMPADGVGGLGTPRPFGTANVAGDQGRSAWGLDVVDLDGDDQLDLLVTSYTDHQLIVFRGVAGGPTFTGPERLSTRDPGETAGTNPIRVAHGDVDNDDDVDVVVATVGGDDLVVFLNDGAGHLTASGWYTTFDIDTGGYPSDVALVDVDGDGVLDAVVTERSLGEVYVLLGQGDGSFITPTHRSYLSSISDVRIASLGGDTLADLFVLDPVGLRLSIVRQQFSGSWNWQSYYIGTSYDDPQQMALGDLDGDTFLDVCMAVDPDDFAPWAYTDPDDADGVVTLYQLNVARDMQDVELVDVVGDTALDAVFVAPDSDEIYVYAGTGTRSSSAFQSSAALVLSTRVGSNGGRFPWRLIVEDVTGDGRPDFVTANLTSDDLTVLPSGLSKGVYDPSQAYLVPISVGGTDPGVSEVASGDFNGDGLLDLVSPLRNRDAVGVVLGFGGGIFSQPVIYDVGQEPADVAVSDLDHDGYDDIITADYADNAVSVLYSGGIDPGVP